MNITTTEATVGAAKLNVGRRPTPAQIDQILADWAASGRSGAEMAAATGWSFHTLYRWRRQAARAAGKPGARARLRRSMVEVPKVPAAGATLHWAAEVNAGGATVRLAVGCSADWAAALVTALRGC